MEETVRVPIKREYRDFNAEEILGKLTNVKYATRQLLYEHYKSEDPETACSYATFCRRLEKLIKEKTPTQIYTNLERIPGESLEVDFAGDSVTWIDRRGKKRTSRLFLATLTFSQKIYIFINQDNQRIPIQRLQPFRPLIENTFCRLGDITKADTGEVSDDK